MTHPPQVLEKHYISAKTISTTRVQEAPGQLHLPWLKLCQKTYLIDIVVAVVNKVDDLRNDLTTDTRLEKFYASVACILILLRLNLTPINLAKETWH